MTNEPYRGLSDAEVQDRLNRGLGNRMPKGQENSIGHILSKHVFTLFNLLNVALAAIVFAVGSYKNMLFLFVVFSNIIIGTVQEIRAKRMHDKLELLGQGKITVLRDGKELHLPPTELVQDDVVILSRGDQIPADAVVLSGSLQADESLLTGESEPVQKTEGSSLSSGSFAVSGSVYARLTAVGENSYAGQLQIKARKVKAPKSMLLQDMRKIIRVVSIAILPIGVLLFLRQFYSLGSSFPDAVTRTVAAVIGMIPEGLILLTSVSLATGVIKLGRKQALVNELYGIESLARTDVVCMDKTGTLTSGAMTAEKVLPIGAATKEDAVRALSRLLGALCEESATNTALDDFCVPVEKEQPLSAVPFSSLRKWSGCTFRDGTLLLGAPEKLLPESCLPMVQECAAQGMRVLALCQSPETLRGESLPQDITPLALFCLRDSLRPNVGETLRYFGAQGVPLKVISGDNAATVSATAAAAGVPHADAAVDLSRLEQKDYASLSRTYTVFGRVSPEDKKGLVDALKADGHGVAMVGDGVNDIPALKAADCSIAMAGGSDAAARVAQITLLDGDFNTMPQIVAEGRRVINNITRSSSLFLIKNILNMLLALTTIVLSLGSYPFQPIQLTLIASIAIAFPSVVLALEPNRERVRGQFLQNVVLRAIPGGVCAALLWAGVLAFCRRMSVPGDAYSTLCTYTTGISCFAALIFICRPINRLRALLLVAVVIAFVGGAMLLPGLYCLVDVSAYWMVLAAAAVLAVPVQLGISALISCFSQKKKEA